MDFKMQNLKNAIMDIASENPFVKQEKSSCAKTVLIASACTLAGIAIGYGAKCVIDRIKEDQAFLDEYYDDEDCYCDCGEDCTCGDDCDCGDDCNCGNSECDCTCASDVEEDLSF